MRRINTDYITIPSSLRVRPTPTWRIGELLPGEMDHLRSKDLCPVCRGWTITENLIVWRPGQGAVKQTVARCVSAGGRYAPRCATRVIAEEATSDYLPPEAAASG
ncbi:MAG: hypothetical protein AB1758_24875 [Candidatus Eremiobacterota bacterium]